MATNATVAAAVLTRDSGQIDPLPALRRLRTHETGVVPARPGLADRMRSRLVLGHRRALRIGSVAAVVGVTMGTLVATGVAGDIVKIFQPETFVAVPVDITSIGTLPDLSGYGSVHVVQTPHLSTAASLADAASSSGLHLLATGKLPSTVKGNPAFYVLSAGSASFTFNAATAAGTAGRLGKKLPTLPSGIDGSSLTLDGGPVVVEALGSQQLRLPGIGTSESASPGEASPDTGVGRLGLLGHLAGIPQVVIVQMKAPALYSNGPTIGQYENALLSMPGVPASLAAEIKALGDPSSTLPIPIPTSLASSHAADINGAPGLVIGDTTGIASGVVWQSHGLLYAVVGSLTDHQVVAIARAMHAA